jgi:hypothetical protein
MVALRSFDWWRIGAGAVRHASVAVSSQTVSAGPMTDAVTPPVPALELIGGGPQFDVTSVSSDRILAATRGDLR